MDKNVKTVRGNAQTKIKRLFQNLRKDESFSRTGNFALKTFFQVKFKNVEGVNICEDEQGFNSSTVSSNLDSGHPLGWVRNATLVWDLKGIQTVDRNVPKAVCPGGQQTSLCTTPMPTVFWGHLRSEAMKKNKTHDLHSHCH